MIATGVILHLHAEGALLGNLGKGAGAHVSVGTLTLMLQHRASSASIALLTRSRSSGTSIWAISSPKNPVITRRRASSNGIPRAIR